MILRAAIIWFAICILAVINGAFREAVLKPRFGERVAHVLSTLILSAAILGVTFVSLDWIGPTDIEQAWSIGIGWVALTLAFEFLAGHYLFGNPWEKILGDYRVTQGRVWILVPMCTLFAPALAHQGLPRMYAVPYGVSLTIAAGILLLSIARPNIARWLVAAIFAYACIYNSWLGVNKPEEYQGFAELALLPWYREFITGPFLANGSFFIVMIAVGQGVIALTTALGGRVLWVGVVGTTMFLAGIAPLGVGSAFPFSAIVALAAWVYLGRQQRSPGQGRG